MEIPGLRAWLDSKAGDSARKKMNERDYVPWEVVGPFLWQFWNEHKVKQATLEARLAAIEMRLASGAVPDKEPLSAPPRPAPRAERGAITPKKVR